MKSTNLQVGDLYMHIHSNNPHILTEISKSCVHLVNLRLGIERTIRNDAFNRYWRHTGDNA